MSRETTPCKLVTTAGMRAIKDQISRYCPDQQSVVADAVHLIKQFRSERDRRSPVQQHQVAGLVAEVIVRQAIHTVAKSNTAVQAEPDYSTRLRKLPTGSYELLDMSGHQIDEIDALPTVDGIPFVIEVKTGERGLPPALNPRIYPSLLAAVAYEYYTEMCNPGLYDNQIGYGVVYCQHLGHDNRFKRMIALASRGNVQCIPLYPRGAEIQQLVKETISLLS